MITKLKNFVGWGLKNARVYALPGHTWLQVYITVYITFLWQSYFAFSLV